MGQVKGVWGRGHGEVGQEPRWGGSWRLWGKRCQEEFGGGDGQKFCNGSGKTGEEGGFKKVKTDERGGVGLEVRQQVGKRQGRSWEEVRGGKGGGRSREEEGGGRMTEEEGGRGSSDG